MKEPSEFPERLLDTVRDCLDTIYTSDEEARAFLGVGRDYFRLYYKPYCGVKQGNSTTYRKSDLLRRREELRKEAKHAEV